MDVHAEDMSFVTIWPEPEKGYSAYFPSMEDARRLFALLAKPYCLEMLDVLGRQKCGFFLPEVLVDKLSVSVEEIIDLLEELKQQGVVESMSLEIDRGEVTAYKVSHPLRLVPLMMAVQGFIETKINYMYNYEERIPLLQGEEWKREREDEHHEEE